MSNLGGIHTDATGFGVSPRGVQGRPLVWIIYTFINVDRPPSRRRVGSLSTLILIKSEYYPTRNSFWDTLLSIIFDIRVVSRLDENGKIRRGGIPNFVNLER